MPDEPAHAGYASRGEVDLLNATVFGTYGQGGILREMEALHAEIRRQSKLIMYGALAMASSLIALAGVIVNHG